MRRVWRESVRKKKEITSRATFRASFSLSQGGRRQQQADYGAISSSCLLYNNVKRTRRSKCRGSWKTNKTTKENCDNAFRSFLFFCSSLFSFIILPSFFHSPIQITRSFSSFLRWKKTFLFLSPYLIHSSPHTFSLFFFHFPRLFIYMTIFHPFLKWKTSFLSLHLSILFLLSYFSIQFPLLFISITFSSILWIKSCFSICLNIHSFFCSTLFFIHFHLLLIFINKFPPIFWMKKFFSIYLSIYLSIPFYSHS